MADRIRSFIAVEIPAELKAAMEKLQGELAGLGVAARWVAGGNIHLTLKFLGSVAAGDLAALNAGLQEVASRHPPMRLSASRVGVFPGPRRARVIWAGLCGETDRLADFRDAVERRLAAVGFAKDPKAFHAHLTLGRFRRSPRPGLLREVMQQYAEVEFGGLQVRQVTLFRSDLSPDGARYTPLQRLELAASG
jgi:2'-5' RNA ligase